MPPFQLPRALFPFAATPRLYVHDPLSSPRGSLRFISARSTVHYLRGFSARFPSSPHLGIYTIPLYRVEVRYDRLEKFTINLRRKFAEL